MWRRRARSKQLFAGEHQHGLLNLGALDFSLVSHLPARIARLRRLQPHLHINVLSRDSLVLERMLIDSDLDLAITDGPIEHPLLASQKAFDERLVLLMPADAGNPTPPRWRRWSFTRSAANVRFA